MPLYAYAPVQKNAPEEPWVTHPSPVAEAALQQGNGCCFFETLQSLSEAPLTQCPHCGHEIARVVTAPAFFKSSSNQRVTKGNGGEGIFKTPGDARDPTPAPAPSPGSTPGERVARLAAGGHRCSAFCKH